MLKFKKELNVIQESVLTGNNEAIIMIMHLFNVIKFTGKLFFPVKNCLKLAPKIPFLKIQENGISEVKELKKLRETILTPHVLVHKNMIIYL